MGDGYPPGFWDQYHAAFVDAFTKGETWGYIIGTYGYRRRLEPILAAFRSEAQ